MSRKAALLLGVGWLGILVAIDLAFLCRPPSLDLHVMKVLESAFVEPPRYASSESGLFRDVVFRNVVLPRPDLPTESLVTIDEVRCQIDWGALLFGRPPVESVSFHGPCLELAWSRTGALELPPLLKSQESGTSTSLPRLRVEGLRVRLINSPYLAPPDVTIVLDELLLQLIPEAGPDWRYDFRAQVRDRALGNLDAWGHLGKKGYGLELRRTGFQLTEGLRQYLSPQFADFLARVRVDGPLELLGKLETDPSTGSIVFSARADLLGVTLAYADWPKAATDLRGVLRYRKGILKSDGAITGSVEGSALWLDGEVDFRAETPRVNVNGGVRGLGLSDDLVQKIERFPDPGPEIAEQLRAFEVRGRCDANFHLATSDDVLGEEEFTLRPTITVEFDHCDLVYRGSREEPGGQREGFVYPLSDLTGTVHLTDLGLWFDNLRAARGGMSLRARGTVDYARAGEETFQAHVVASRMPVDQALLDALDKETREGVQQLNLTGHADVQVIVEQKRGTQEEVVPTVEVDLLGVRMEPAPFPYLLEDVRGRITVRQDTIVLDGLAARHGSSRLGLSGEVGITTGRSFIDVAVTGSDVEIDQGLLTALSKVDEGLGRELARRLPRGRFAADLHVQTGQGRTVPHVRGDLELLDVSFLAREPGLRVEALRGLVQVRTIDQFLEISLLKGASARIVAHRFDIHGGWSLGRGFGFEVSAPELQIDKDLLDVVGVFIPGLADAATRPEIEGPAGLNVRLSDRGKGLEMQAQLQARGLRLRPPHWRDTRLTDIFGALTVTLDRIVADRLVAVIERPASLPPPPPRLLSSNQTAPFNAARGIEVSVQSCTITGDGGRPKVALGELHLSDVPLEGWVFDLLPLTVVDRERLRIPGLAGSMTLGVRSATFRKDQLVLNGAVLDVLGLHLGPDRLYLERGSIDDLDVVVSPQGAVRFDGSFRGRNFRLLGVPVPRFEGRIVGDDQGIGLAGLEGVLFGHESDRFDILTASGQRLRARALDREYLTQDVLENLSDDEVRELVTREENRDVTKIPREELIELAIKLGPVARDRAKRMDTEELQTVVREGRMSQPLGRLDPDQTRFGLEWSTGRFMLDAHLQDVRLAPVVRILGGDPGDVRGRLVGRLSLGGLLDDASSFTGEGVIRCNAYNVIQLPVFLNILKALDIVSMFSSGGGTDIVIEFDVAQRAAHLKRADVQSRSLKLSLAGPGVITFGGIIDARFDASHSSAVSIPLISDILKLLPSLVFNGLEVQGPLEDPIVTPRSLGFGDSDPTAPHGRRPVLKDPKQH